MRRRSGGSCSQPDDVIHIYSIVSQSLVGKSGIFKRSGEIASVFVLCFKKIKLKRTVSPDFQCRFFCMTQSGLVMVLTIGLKSLGPG